MKRFALTRDQARKALTVIALTSALGGIPDARAIHCIESLLPVGKPSLIPMVEELDTRQIAEKKPEMTVLLSKKPRVSVKPEGTVAIMLGESKTDLMVIGVEGQRPYFRPDVHEVRGFIRYATPEGAAAAGAVSPNRMYNPKAKIFLYGKPGAEMRQVTLEINETIAAHAAIDPDHQLVVTVRTDQKLGFLRASEDAQRNFMIEVYQLESKGHAVISFRVDANEVPYPKVRILSDTEGKKFYLQIEQNYFELSLLPPSAFGA